MDWDLDGILDIIVGDRPGSIHFFRGTEPGGVLMEEQPLLEVGGVPIRTGLNSSPAVTDYNGNGLPDLVVGRLEGYYASVLLFMNEGIPGEPLFLNTDTVFCAGEPIHFYAAYPDMADLTGNGLDDLVLGNSTGRIPCYINSGTPEEPLFSEYEYLKADGEEIDFSTYVRPSICDWDEDGTPDMLVADCSGMVHLFLGVPNTGTAHGEGSGAAGPLLTVPENPVTGVLRPKVRLGGAGTVATFIYSVDGRLLREDCHGSLEAGAHTLFLDLSGLPPGSLVLVCAVGDLRSARPFTLLGP